MKAKLTYTVRNTRAPGETQDTIVPVLVDRLQPVDLETVVESAIDRGLIAGLKSTAAHTIAEGVAAQIAREFALGRGVIFGQYFYGRPYLSSTVDANGRVTSANGINVRLYKGDAFKLTLGDYTMNFDGSGDSVKIEYVMGNTDAAGGNTRGQIVANQPVVVQGLNFWAAGDTDKVAFVEADAAGGTPVEVTEFTAQGPGILSFAWPAGIEAGKKYNVTVSRTDPNGVTRTSSAKAVSVKAGSSPVGPAPTITGAKTRGDEDDHINVSGGTLDVTGENLETATAIDLLNASGELRQTVEATYADGKLTAELEFEDRPSATGAVRVTTAGGSATHNVSYSSH